MSGVKVIIDVDMYCLTVAELNIGLYAGVALLGYKLHTAHASLDVRR